MWSGGDDDRTDTFELNRPLDDTMTLKIELIVGLKTVTVPFEIKDVELP
jgi:hypothetical protein